MTDRVVTDFGLKMKRAREERGVSLRQIATETKISVSALEALERNDISRLPGGIFSRAFVRAYAVEVGLDPEETIREFITQFPHDSVTQGSPHVPQEDHAAIESSRQSAQTLLKLLAISLPVAAAIIYFTVTYGPNEPADASAPEAPAAARVAEAPNVPVTAMEPSPAGDAAPTPAARPLPVGAEPLRFEIVAIGPLSIQLDVDGGVRRESRAVATGEQVMVQADREMTLTMSDAGAVQLTINGQPAVSLGSAGEARTIQIGRQNYGAFLASQ
jgi:cytoskeleton protein RodZ